MTIDAQHLMVGFPLLHATTNTLVPVTFTIDGPTDALEWTFCAPRDDTITHLFASFAAGSRAGTPVQHKLELSTIDVTAIPSVQGTVLGTASFTPPADASFDGTGQWFAFDAAATVAIQQGTVYMVRLSPVGTPDAGNRSIFNYAHGASSVAMNVPSCRTVDGGVRANQSRLPIFGLKSATRAYGVPIAVGVSTTFSAAVDGTLGNQRAMKVSLPASMGDRFQIVGFMGNLQLSSVTGKIAVLSLYDDVAGSAALQEVEFATGVQAAANTAPSELFFDEDTLATLKFGKSYYLAWGPKNTAQNMVSRHLTLAAAADRLAFPGGDWFCHANRSSVAAGFTDVTTERPCIGAIIRTIGKPAGELIRAGALVR